MELRWNAWHGKKIGERDMYQGERRVQRPEISTRTKQMRIGQSEEKKPTRSGNTENCIGERKTRADCIRDK